ncbi:GntR family transcriptional regulator [Rhodoligotrophos defluvii]|uniref:GntR family transcriptional regulator n=1 Tax=Rhodoligotrophos defluvii TaxID=2561934 RepID=UPI001484C887|nr:GntR family transcriptional regulator [Rhodoligotrophos defluvii]
MNTAAVHPKRKAPHAGGGALRRHAYETLKGMILSANFHPGERLSELRLSEMIGVSRTPLREALMLLEAEGLVIGKSNSGYSVLHFDPRSIRDLLIAREGLDGYSAEIACRMATEDDFEQLRRVMADIEELARRDQAEPVEIARKLELGLKVHEVIAAATKNTVIQDMTRRLYEQLQAALWLEVLWLTSSWTDAIVQHRAIVDAVLARDVPRAIEAAREHVRDSLRNMARIEELYEGRRRLFEPLAPRSDHQA